MKKQRQRVLLGYRRLSDTNVVSFALNIADNLYSQAHFPSPPVSHAELMAETKIFSDRIAATVQGGTSATAKKNEQRAKLSMMLKRLAYYVDVQSDNNLAVLLSSGFSAVNTNRTSEQLPTPSILKIKNGIAGQSLTTVSSSPNSRLYELQTALVDESGALGEWVSAGSSTTSRNIPVNGMICARMYAYRARAMGGLTGHSDWSDSVYHRAY